MSITRINTNTDALMAGANLRKMEFSLSRTMSHLSTGLRIVTAVDDPSGMALSATFQAQMRGTNQAVANAEDGLSLIQLADAALADNMDILLRMRDITVRASSDATLTTAQRTSMSNEITNLQSELTRRAGALTFNSKVLFDGGLSGVEIQVGADNLQANRITITIPICSAADLDGSGGCDLTAIDGFSTAAEAQSALTGYQSAITTLSDVQEIVGVQARGLERIINTLSAAEVNMAAAFSRLTDADMASEISDFAKQQVIAQAATAMIAQANAQPQMILKLLGM